MKTSLFLKLDFCCCCLLFLLYIAWPWAPLWHDDALSTLMVHDGIKTLSGGHSRCSEPRPWVALDGRRAVIYVPHCQSWPPPPSLKNPSICHISRGRPSARRALFCHSQAHCRTRPECSCGTRDKKNTQSTQIISDCISVDLAYILRSSFSRCLFWAPHNFVSLQHAEAKRRDFFAPWKVHFKKMTECLHTRVSLFLQRKKKKQSQLGHKIPLGDGSF